MKSLQKREDQLPATTDGLQRFILVGKKRLQAHVALIQAIKSTSDASDAHEAALADAQDLSDLVIMAVTKLGELLAAMPKPKPIVKGSPDGSLRGTVRVLPEGITKSISHKAQTLANNKQMVDEITEKMKEKGGVPTPNGVYLSICRKKKEDQRKNIISKAETGFEVYTQHDINDAKKEIRKMGVARIEADRIPEAVKSIRLAFNDNEIKKLVAGLVEALKTEPDTE